MKLLFLDIDGVLNSKRSDLALGKEKTVKNLDPLSLKLVKLVVEETGCVICLSSEWRYEHNYIELGKELGLPILFETEHTEEHDRKSLIRGEEIKDVVEGLNPDKFCVLDDNEFGDEFEGMNMVDVAEEVGVGYMDYKLLIEYLK